VLDLLEQGEFDTKDIIQRWADIQGQPYNAVRNKIFNILTTLKKIGKIKGRRIEGENITVYSK
jgi:hypothetical protein